MYISLNRNSQVTTNLPSSPSNSDISETASLPLVIREKDVEYQVIHTLSTCSADKLTLTHFFFNDSGCFFNENVSLNNSIVIHDTCKCTVYSKAWL